MTSYVYVVQEINNVGGPIGMPIVFATKALALEFLGNIEINYPLGESPGTTHSLANNHRYYVKKAEFRNPAPGESDLLAANRKPKKTS